MRRLAPRANQQKTRNRESTPVTPEQPMMPLRPVRLIPANPSKLHRHASKKHMNIRRTHNLEQTIRLSIRGRENHLLRLVAE